MLKPKYVTWIAVIGCAIALYLLADKKGWLKKGTTTTTTA